MPVVKTFKLRSAIRIALLIGLGWGLSVGSPCFSQDETLEQLQTQWTEIQAKFAEKLAIIKADEGDAEAARAEFQVLIDQSDDLIMKIDTAAKTILESTPNDPRATRVRLGIMLNEAQNGDSAMVLAKGESMIQSGIDPKYFEVASKSERLSIAAKELFDELLIRQAEAKSDDLPRVKFTTTQGDIVIELFENEAPETVGNFVSLVESGFYSDRLFHRVVDKFMAQAGGFKLSDDDKEVDGEGPGYEIKCECDAANHRLHFDDSISMAHHGKDTGGSQFFLTFERTSFLDGRHTCFGRVIQGQDTLEKMNRTHISGALSPSGREEPIADVKKDKIIKAEIVRKRDHEYVPNKVVVPPADTNESADENDGGSADEKTIDEKEKDTETEKKKS